MTPKRKKKKTDRKKT